MSALLLIFEPLGSGGVVVIPPVAVPIPITIYEALVNEFDIPEVTFMRTWFLSEKAPFPTVSLQRLTRSNYAEDTCNVRIEQANYQFNVHSLYRDQLDRVLNRIESLYDFSLPIYNSQTGRRFNSIHWDSRNETELEPGIWYGYINYLVYCERDKANIDELVEADSLEEAITKKYRLAPIFNLSWGRERSNYPYTNIPSFNSSLRESLSTSRLENVRFGFETFCRSLEQSEILAEQLINLYDYSNFVISHKTFTTIQYDSDEIMEVEPGIWKSTINWIAVLEKDIT